MGTNRAAQIHAENPLANCISSHWGIDGLTPDMRYSLAGGYQVASENVFGSDYCKSAGLGYSAISSISEEVQEAMDGWMNSPGHRENILRPRHRKVNIGLALDRYNFRAVQQFEGDYVELTLVNSSSNQLQHNVDFHASIGALGGGSLTHVNPGQEVALRFRVIKPGVFVYHCAPGSTMVPWHVVHGMSGAILVLPRDGLKDPAGNPISYDRAYYIGEQDYYVPRNENGDFIRYETAAESFADDLEAMTSLTPTHIVFNGATGALQGDGQLTARVGENLLIIHSQANRQSYPHLIGGHGDYVWERGSFNNPPALDMETWDIAAGSAGASIHALRQPGTYVYLSHNLIEAFVYDAKAILEVEGEWDSNLMEQIKEPGDIE